jgi:protein-S-isoprenylcysteine O-methyltransferase Ste14
VHHSSASAGLADIHPGHGSFGILATEIPQQEERRKIEQDSAPRILVERCAFNRVWCVYPGLTRFDEVFGIKPLPRLSILYIVGSIMLFIGMCFFIASYVTIRLSEKGAPAFLLTKRVARIGIYRWTRNPMALGLYIGLLGFGLFLRSFYWTLGGIFVIPIHIFYLKFFEEFELELRMGQPYLEYKQIVPFLVPRWKSQSS